MPWYVTANGKTDGPMDDGAVIGAIRGGLPPNAQVCEVGTQNWVGLTAYPPFAEALRSSAPPPPPPAPGAIDSRAEPIDRMPMKGRRTLLIILGAVVLCGAGVAIVLATMDKKAQPTPAELIAEQNVKMARDQAARLRSLIQMWKEQNRLCPDIKDLGLSKVSSSDPWGKDYDISCGPGTHIEVRSFGPDGRMFTSDDITAECEPPSLRCTQ